jgi:hypothetical protein
MDILQCSHTNQTLTVHSEILFVPFFSDENTLQFTAWLGMAVLRIELIS